MRKNLKLIKISLREVNESLRYYEKDYLAVRRYPGGEKEIIQNFEQYLEARINMELSKIPDLQEAIILTEGNLFKIEELKDLDLSKKRFGTVKIKVLEPEDIENPNDKIILLLQKVKTWIGGSNLTFNSVKQRIKLVVE